jgi:hypothetical protein
MVVFFFWAMLGIRFVQGAKADAGLWFFIVQGN